MPEVTVKDEYGEDFLVFGDQAFIDSVITPGKTKFKEAELWGKLYRALGITLGPSDYLPTKQNLERARKAIEDRIAKCKHEHEERFAERFIPAHTIKAHTGCPECGRCKYD